MATDNWCENCGTELDFIHDAAGDNEGKAEDDALDRGGGKLWQGNIKFLLLKELQEEGRHGPCNQYTNDKNKNSAHH